MGEKKQVRYIDTDVLTEAKKRINHVLNNFDKIFVCFSGGKDSLVVLHLVEQVYKENNISEKINVIFRDEELIPDDVVDFVTEHVKSGKYNFYYYAVRLYSEKFILGKTYQYIQWDNEREWVREKPDFAITDPLDRVFSQHTMDEFCASGHKGKLAFLNGIRADESILRYQSCLNKKNENYINASGTPNVHLVKPIYDWSEKDVFKFFYDNDIKYCEIYDNQMWARQNLRVSTPFHAEAAKRFDKVKTVYPVFYQQLINIFPEMLMQEKYWGFLDRDLAIEKYPKSWNGIFQYIKENIEDPRLKKLAIKRVLSAKMNRENKIKKNPESIANYGGYPVYYVFKKILKGEFEREIQPQSKLHKKDIEFENDKGWVSNGAFQEKHNNDFNGGAV